MDKKIKTPEKIIHTTIECIERYGFDALTVRMIAEAANVNIAAVNYHFRSKENLVEQVKRITFDHMIEDLQNMSEKDKPFKDIARDMCMYMLEGGARFPYITRLHFHEAFSHGNIDAKSYKYMNDFLKGFADRISQKHNIDRKELNMSLHRLFSNLLFVSIFPGLFKDFTGYSLKDEARARVEFAEGIVADLPF